MLYHRNITDRVTTIAPFLRYDEDPYLVVSADGRLFWIRDAYTITSRYPYSTPVGGRPQLHPQLRQGRHRRLQRHDRFLPGRSARSARADAGARLPGLLKPLEAMPADLRQHISAIPRRSSRSRRRCTRPIT